MAEAQRITETVIVDKGISLSLTNEEAQVLIDILAKVGGHSDFSRRKHADSVYYALSKVGFKYDLSDVEGTISFTKA